VKKYLLPLGAGVVVFGVVTAFAASLGVTSSSLGAGNATVASCNDNAAVSYTTTGSKVATAVVTISGSQATGACDGKTAQVTITGTGTGLPASATAAVGSTTTNIATVNLASANADAHDVTGVSVVITG
jgi:hypothetical protein